MMDLVDLGYLKLHHNSLSDLPSLHHLHRNRGFVQRHRVFQHWPTKDLKHHTNVSIFKYILILYIYHFTCTTHNAG